MKLSNIVTIFVILALVVSVVALCFVALHGTETTQAAPDVSATPSGVTEHTHEYSQQIVVAPTCTEDGYTKFICSICHDSYIGDEPRAHGHRYVMDRLTIATETTPSRGFMRCETCGGVESAELKIWLGTQTGGGTESAEPQVQSYTITLHNAMGGADEPYTGLPGTTFRLYYKENGSWTTKNEWQKTTPVTGILTWLDLAEGEYCLKAEEASAGFELCPLEYTFVFPRDGDADVTLYNEPFNMFKQ